MVKSQSEDKRGSERTLTNRAYFNLNFLIFIDWLLLDKQNTLHFDFCTLHFDLKRCFA